MEWVEISFVMFDLFMLPEWFQFPFMKIMIIGHQILTVNIPYDFPILSLLTSRKTLEYIKYELYTEIKRAFFKIFTQVKWYSYIMKITVQCTSNYFHLMVDWANSFPWHVLGTTGNCPEHIKESCFKYNSNWSRLKLHAKFWPVLQKWVRSDIKANKIYIWVGKTQH